jgi:hypothetical protein
VVEYRDISGRVKKQFLDGREYWYLNMIARHPERKEPGKMALSIYFDLDYE